MKPPTHILARLALWPLSLLVRGASGLRTAAYRRGWLSVERVRAPVISVGNLSVGGTGKTPLVAAICTLLQEEGIRTAVVSRGYGRRHSGRPTVVSRGDGKGPIVDVAQAGDEPYLLALALPATAVVVAARRVEGARLVLREFGTRVIVADDAYQHHRLGRDVDLLVMNATDPTGGGWVLPAGGLREPLSAAGRASAFLLSHCDRVGHTTQAVKLQKQHNPTAPMFPSVTHPVEIVFADGTRADPHSLDGKSVMAFCGIGNPAFFRQDLERLGARVLGFLAFPDHHWYVDRDLETIQSRAKECGASCCITTEKDFVRLSEAQRRMTPVMGRLRIGVEFWEKRRFRKFLLSRLPLEAAA